MAYVKRFTQVPNGFEIHRNPDQLEGQLTTANSPGRGRREVCGECVEAARAIVDIADLFSVVYSIKIPVTKPPSGDRISEFTSSRAMPAGGCLTDRPTAMWSRPAHPGKLSKQSADFCLILYLHREVDSDSGSWRCHPVDVWEI